MEGFDLSFNGKTALELYSALREHSNIFYLKFLCERKLRSFNDHVNLLANLKLFRFF